MPMSSSATSGRRSAKLRSAECAVVRELHLVAFEAKDDRETFGGVTIVVGEQDALVRPAAIARCARPGADAARRPRRNSAAAP